MNRSVADWFTGRVLLFCTNIALPPVFLVSFVLDCGIVFLYTSINHNRDSINKKKGIQNETYIIIYPCSIDTGLVHGILW